MATRKPDAVMSAGASRHVGCFARLVHKLPVPEAFYARDERLELRSKRSRAFNAALSLNVLVLLVLAGALAYYSIPAQHVNDVVIGGDIVLDGYLCRPLGKDPWYRVNYTYDECREKLRTPTNDTIDFSSVKIQASMGNKCWGDAYFLPFEESTKGIENTGAQGVGLNTPKMWYHDQINVALNPGCTNSSYQQCQGYTYISSGMSDDIFKVSCNMANAINHTLIVSMFEKLVDLSGDMCAFTKTNMPYVCTRSEPMDIWERMALAHENSSIAYAVLAAVFVRFITCSSSEVTKAKPAIKAKNESKKHWVYRLPIPPEFYDEENELDFIAHPFVVGVFTLFCLFLLVGGFAGFMAYYSLPVTYIKETVVTDEYSKSGYNCRPLRTDTHYGVNYTRTECLTNVRTVSAQTMTFESSEQTDKTQAIFYPFGNSSGVGFATTGLSDFSMPSQYTAQSIETWQTAGQVPGEKEAARVIINTASPTSFQKDAAVEVMLLMQNHLGDKVCDFTELNAPHVCRKEAPPDIITRIALAYGNADLIYAIVTIVFSVLIKQKSPFIKEQLARSKESRNPRVWLSRMPIPETFFEEEEMELIAPPEKVGPGVLLAFFLFTSTFAGLLGFYSSPLQYSTETVITGEYVMEGFKCNPLQKDDWYGVNYTYDECLNSLVRPSLNTINFAALSYNSTTGKYTDTTDNVVRFNPFGDLTGQGYPHSETTLSGSNLTGFDQFWSDLQDDVQNAQDGGGSSGPPSAPTDSGSSSDPTGSGSPPGRRRLLQFVGGGGANVGLGGGGANVGLDLKSSASKGVYIYYDGQSTNKNDTVVDAFRKLYDEIGDAKLCEFAKNNAPHKCVREVSPPWLERVALAYGWAEIVFGFICTAVATLIVRRQENAERAKSKRAAKTRGGP